MNMTDTRSALRHDVIARETAQPPPGPWTVRYATNLTAICTPIGEFQISLHGIYDGLKPLSISLQEWESLARLIAAAPETAAERDLLRKDLAHGISLWEKTTAERDRLREVNAELLAVANGALGYLLALPSDHRPDAQWLAPLNAVLAAAEGETP